MATIKSYTDINQSKKLAEFLLIESADMSWVSCDDGQQKYYQAENRKIILNYEKNHWLPCWSLAALLSALPNEIITDNKFECHYQIHIRKYDGGDNTTLYQIAYGNDRGSSGFWHDMINTGEKESLIDCCVQMILKLHELKML